MGAIGATYGVQRAEKPLGGRRSSALVHLGLALLVYVPILRTRPGAVGADTKTYLYLDPAKLLARATSMWDPNVGMGTVTHQTIGYLFPMGPWYWLFERLGAPDWVAQRLWLATVMFAAGAGVLFLARTLGWKTASAASVVAALVYMLSPYVLDYSARISVILLPWAALPWLVALAERALRRGGLAGGARRRAVWRHPALFALVVLAVGGVNATALVFAGLAPVLWFPFAVARGDTTARQALATVARIGVLTAGVSLWWVAGLAVQGGYGIDILRYTETVEAVARTSLSSEVLRGLGYWFFYGNDKLGPWIESSVPYTQSPLVLAVTFAVPVVALGAAAFLRWRHRAYCLTLVVIGTVIAVGAYPYDTPTPAGHVVEAFATSSTVGLALRSTARALPLVLLGFALLIGAAIGALARQVPRAAFVVAPLCAVLAVGALPPLFTGDLAVVDNLNRAEELPRWWPDAAQYLDGRDDGTRVLELPGSDFAAYRWGNTVDPVTPYLMDRPYVARELIPYGSPASADVLNALDRRLQEGVFEPQALAPLARLMGVGDVVLRSDLQHERYRTPRPRSLWREMTSPRPPPGLGSPVPFGPATPNRPVPELPLVDEIELGTDVDAPHPPRVAAFAVDDPVPIVRVEDGAAPMVVDGDGEALVDLAAAGLLGRGPVHYAATVDEATLQRATLVVTDTNRLRARRWGTVRENTGYTEASGLGPLREDPGDARLDVFGDADVPYDAHTTVEQRGVRAVRATRYGNPVSYTPEDRPANAVDDDAGTAWRVGAFADVTGERLRVDLRRPERIGTLALLQPTVGPRNRWITRLRVHLDDHSFDVTLDETSRTGAVGQLLRFPPRSAQRVELEVLETNVGRRPRYDGVSGVGFAHVGLGTTVDEVVRMPRQLLRRAGSASADRPLAVVMTRLRSNPAEPVRFDEEPRLARTFRLPSSRSFLLTGTARLSATAPDRAVDQAIRTEGVEANSTSRLPGSLRSRARAAIDGDPSTAWTPGFLAQEGHSIQITLRDAITFDRLDLQVVADGRHSVPTRLRITSEEPGSERVVDLPAVTEGSAPGSVTRVPLRFEPVRGSELRFEVDGVRHVRTIDYYSEAPIELPVAIAELGLPGVDAGVTRGLAPDCRDGLVTVDGRPVAVRITGDVEAALDRAPLALEACEPVTLGPGDHVVRSSAGSTDGFDVDRLVLTSMAGGVAGPLPPPGPPARSPGLRVVGQTRTSYDLAIERADRSPHRMLVLGQSHNRGWRATDQSGRDLGPPRLVDGYANGWTLPAGTTRVHLEWRPQRMVWIALALSALAALLCLALAVFCRLERGTERHVPSDKTSWEARWESAAAGWLPWAWAGGVTAFGLLVGGPVVGAGTAAIVLGARLARRRRGGVVLALAPPALLAAAAAYVIVQQVRYGYPPDFAWPVNTSRAHTLAWVAVVVLLASNGLKFAEVSKRCPDAVTEQH